MKAESVLIQYKRLKSSIDYAGKIEFLNKHGKFTHEDEHKPEQGHGHGMDMIIDI
jgi:hypothetical protein